jgi:hypothetical protein
LATCARTTCYPCGPSLSSSMHPTEPISSSCVTTFRLSVMFGLPRPFAAPNVPHRFAPPPPAPLVPCSVPLGRPSAPCTAHTLGPSFTSSRHCAALVLPHHPCTVLLPGRAARTPLDLTPRPLTS